MAKKTQEAGQEPAREEAERLLQRFSEAPGVSGREEEVRRIFREEVDSAGNHVWSADRSGCLMASCEGEDDKEEENRPRVMLTAHMDEVGFMVQNITKHGFIEFVPLGGWWEHTVLGQGVNVMNGKGELIPGCVASIPPHQLDDSAQSRVMKLEQMSVDVGAESRKQVMEEMGIQLGDVIVPATWFQRLAHPDRFLGKAFDNRVGMAALTQTLQRMAKKRLGVQLLGVATVQEELGCRGAKTAAALARPDLALVLEGPPADDTPGMSREDAQGSLGGGPQIRIMDPRALSSRRLVDYVVACAREAGIRKLPVTC